MLRLLSAFVGADAIEKDDYYGNGKSKWIAFDSIDENGVHFSDGRRFLTFKFDWIEIQSAIEGIACRLTLKENPTYSILLLKGAS